jgi:hypothetical protein
MSELDRFRSAFEAVPAPGETTVQAARTRLLGEIAASSHAVRRRRPRVRLLAATAGVAVAALAGVLAVVIPRGDSLTGPEIAEAAARVLSPPPGTILHSVVRWTVLPAGYGGWSPTTTERWVSTGRRGVVHERSQWGEWETGPCGSLRYIRRTNLLTVDGTRYPDYVHQLADPAAEYLRAQRSGRVRYRGKTTVRGIPAYTLAVSGPDTGVEVTYVVRRDNYFPLRTVRRYTHYGEIYTYTDFEQISRTPATEPLLHVRPRPGAFVLGGRGYHRAKPGCAGFRSYEHLTGKGKP